MEAEVLELLRVLRLAASRSSSRTLASLTHSSPLYLCIASLA